MADLSIAGCRLIDLDVKGDDRGSLIAIERATGLPFDVARAYFIYGTKPGVARGFHAHRQLTQWLVCVAGACTVRLDDGRKADDIRLDRPDIALQVGPMTWREMHDFSSDCVLLVLADAAYDEADYIRDLAEFRSLVTA